MLSKINWKSDLVKPIMILTSGTLLAQSVSYLLSPVITRLYSPEEFGFFGIIMRIVAFVAVIGAARYEYAIPLPKKDKHAFQIYRITLRILVWTVFLSFLSGGIYWLVVNQTSSFLIYMVFTVLIIAFTVFNNIGRHWAIRTKAFRKISIAALFTSIFTNGAKLITGLASFGVIGLVISTVLGLFFGGLVYLFEALGLFRNTSFKNSPLQRAVLARQYRDFPRINLPHTLIDAGRELMIAFFLTWYLSAEIFGSYDHSFRMLKIPLILIGASIGQVLYNKMSEKFAANEPLYELLKKSILTLIIIGIIPFTVIFIWGAPIFSFVFGEQWELAGEIAAAIAPWLMANFVASSISMVPNVIGELRWFFWVGLTITSLQLLCFGFLPQLMSYFEVNEVTLIAGISWLMFALFFGLTYWMLVRVQQVDRKVVK